MKEILMIAASALISSILAIGAYHCTRKMILDLMEVSGNAEDFSEKIDEYGEDAD